MARVGTPVDGAMEVRAECGEGSGNWKDGAKRARSGGCDGECRAMDGKMVQRVRPQVSGIFSFYSIKRDLLPTRVRRWSCLGGSLSITCGSG